ncbi:MAG TPA: DNA polymerase III subunit gamma/tau [Longimicrobiales bacterium]
MMRQALARSYRPRRFGEIAFQHHVSETLKAAVARGRAAHAYLFSGPRGVGKTTAARVLAMALNCQKRTDEGEPCGECESCTRIWSGRTSLDVVEIDAASNRGVDDARDLRERAMYAPTDADRYKVYIIDEAHMLTREAWNALLKILEEPPPRVIFVFATTEPQKIQQAAPPILSRCQRFDFRRIGVDGIVARLREVLAAEGIEADDDALIPIARRAEGGMRDALSLLDQVLSFAGDRRVTAADVREVLGLVGDELYLELFAILADHRHADVFRFVQRLLDEGYDFAEFYRGLADALRRVILVKLEGAGDDVRPDLRDAYAECAARFAIGDLIRMLGCVAELDTEGRLRKSGSPRIILEALLLRFAHLDRTVELEELLRAMTGEGSTPRAPSEPVAPRPAAGPSAPARSRPAPRIPETPEPARGTEQAGHAAPPPTAGHTAQPEAVAAPIADPAAAFTAILRAGDGVPPGLAAFLKAARVLADGDDQVFLELPPGPGLDRLTAEPASRRSLEQALGRRLGRDVTLGVRAIDASAGRAEPPPRLTPEQVKRDRLTRLMREEPLLERAVQEWDLESLD